MAAAKLPNGLTAKQEAFAQAVAAGKDSSAAYREIYSAEKMTDKTIWETSCRLRKKSNVRARIKELQQQTADAALWAREDMIDMLHQVAQEGHKSLYKPVMGTNADGQPVQTGQIYDAQAAKAITGAVETAAKLCGYNAPEKIDVTGSQTNPFVVQIAVVKNGDKK